jgi:hypothetical protein
MGDRPLVFYCRFRRHVDGRYPELCVQAQALFVKIIVRSAVDA